MNEAKSIEINNKSNLNLNKIIELKIYLSILNLKVKIFYKMNFNQKKIYMDYGCQERGKQH